MKELYNIHHKELIQVYNYGTYNPAQSRIDALRQQKQMLDNQIQSLQQMSGIPPININNNMTPPQTQTNYDGNFKWVDSEEQAKQVANNNLPLILFDNNNPIFYMKDGRTFKKFRFEEITEPVVSPNNDALEGRMDSLETKLNSILNALNGQSPTPQEGDASFSENSKPVGKGGNKK